MKFALVLAVFLSTVAAHASDLSRDLQTPFTPNANPFEGAALQPLATSVAEELRAVLERCAFVPGKFNGLGTLATELDAQISPSCTSLSLKGQNGLTVRTENLNMEIVSWDGSQSDGGDEQAIGVYEGSTGLRIAVFPALFVDGNVIDGIARAVGASLPVLRQ